MLEGRLEEEHQKRAQAEMDLDREHAEVETLRQVIMDLESKHGTRRAEWQVPSCLKYHAGLLARCCCTNHNLQYHVILCQLARRSDPSSPLSYFCAHLDWTDLPSKTGCWLATNSRQYQIHEAHKHPQSLLLDMPLGCWALLYK